MEITATDINNHSIWESFLKDHPEANFLQSYYHGLTHQKVNKKVYFRGYYRKNNLVGVCLLITEEAKRGKHLIVPGGPILNWTDKQLVTFWKDDIKKLATKNSCVFVRVRPQLLDDKHHQALFKSLGFINSPMHLSAETTLQLDLSPTLDQLLSNMRKTTRYEINKGLKLGIKVVKSNQKKDLETFLKLQDDTAKRQKFVPFPNKLITAELESFKNNGAFIYSAYFGKKLLSQALIIHYHHESSYHFGASTINNFKYPGSYAIQWQAIQDAKALKISRYNFWGVVKEDQVKHRFYGVSVFKRGFQGIEVNYLKAKDLVINPILYLPNFIVETLRKRLRHL